MGSKSGIDQPSTTDVSDKSKHVSTDDYKVFCDPVHGHISLHPLLVKIIDTPQFQRLRNIKQVGTTYFVYPGASHNRFEHCIGTAHLAGKLARIIQQKQPDLGVNNKDVLCVEMAGLCHDLGHGPFSHVFDDVILRRLRPTDCDWTHEKGSCIMLDHLIKDNNLSRDMQDYEITEIDIKFVKEMIAGPLKKNTDPDAWPYEGRGEDKSFLYEIISNKRNGVDVDKFDYFARDCHHLGIRNTFDHNRFMMFVKVLKVDKPGERLQICARGKECDNLYGMFHMRSGLYRKAGYHTTAKIINCMIADAMVSADEYLKIPGKDGVPKKISECVDDPVAYTNLNDGIFYLIVYSTEPELEPAREILNRVLQRRLYKQIGTIKWSINGDGVKDRQVDLKEMISLKLIDCTRCTLNVDTGDEFISSILTETEGEGQSFPKIDAEKVLAEIRKFSQNKLSKDDLVSSTKKFNYGMKNKNPVDNFMFYPKTFPEKPLKMTKENVSAMLPDVFEEFEILIICKEEDKVDSAEKSFVEWSKNAKQTSLSSVESTRGCQSAKETKLGSIHDGRQKRNMVVRDPVHGDISLHPALVKIIDTPQFQRLRHIKQLGFTYFVYPGASHNRFEHSIGTAHLAGKLARSIQKNQPYLGVSDKDVLCVEIAGLCHDLGHGPFSHFFDKFFLKRLSLSYKWTHEEASCKILDHLIEVNGLWSVLKTYNIDEDEIEFVKEMIMGPLAKNSSPKGRGRDKSFLYEIVANKRNGVDVDKWDYFARDCHHLGIRNSFDHNRFMMFVKVLKIDQPGELLQICARDKECDNLYGMFQTRSILHRRAYQHRVSMAIDCMLADALELANSHIQIPGKDGAKKTISECLGLQEAASYDRPRGMDCIDVEAYTKLNDGIFDHIVYSTKPELEPARAILRRVLQRKLYKTIGIIKHYNSSSTKKESILSGICSQDERLNEEDLILSIKYVDFGMGSKNPIDKFMFYSKSDPEKPFHMRKEDVSVMWPVVFEESEVLIFCKNDKKVKVAKDSFRQWEEKQKNQATSSRAATTDPGNEEPSQVDQKVSAKKKSGKRDHQDDREVTKQKKAKKGA